MDVDEEKGQSENLPGEIKPTLCINNSMILQAIFTCNIWRHIEKNQNRICQRNQKLKNQHILELHNRIFVHFNCVTVMHTSSYSIIPIIKRLSLLLALHLKWHNECIRGRIIQCCWENYRKSSWKICFSFCIVLCSFYKDAWKQQNKTTPDFSSVSIFHWISTP